MSRPRGSPAVRSGTPAPLKGTAPILSKLWGLEPDETPGWLKLAAAARAEKTPLGRRLANEFANHLRSRDMVPLDSTEDLPPHVVGHVALSGTKVSLVHSFDLDNLSGFPGAMEVLASDGPLRDGAPEPFLRFLNEQSDMAYLRRVVLTRNPARAEELLRASAARGSAAGPARHLLLDLLESQGRWKEATEEARRGSEMASPPGDPAHALLDLLEVLAAQGRHEEALRELSGPTAAELCTAMGRSPSILRASFRARALGSPADATHVSYGLAELVGLVKGQADSFMPGVREEAMETYARLPEWTELQQRGLDDLPMEETLTFGLYFAFAHRSAEWPDPPAEALYRHRSLTYGLVRPIDQAIHQSRHGRFQIARSTGSRGQRRMLLARDVLSQQELKVSFVPSAGVDDELDKPGTVFRSHLVPWQGLWFVRGALEIQDDLSGPHGPRLWFVDMIHPKEEVWVAYVIEGEHGLVASAEVEPYPSPGAVTRALAMALRTLGHLPDLLVSPPEFPFVDPTGRTASSWREAPISPMDQTFASAAGPTWPSWPRPVSLLKPWIETFGVRHVTGRAAVESATREFRDVVWRDLDRNVEVRR
jgi:tetratricopeptide (TPR) repeat protein